MARLVIWLVLLVVLTVLAGIWIRDKLLDARLLRANPDTIASTPVLERFAIGRGAPVYRAHCADCHGAHGTGDPSRGIPDLTDQDWLYGSGQVSDIERVVDYGIRARNPKTWNMAVMPALGRANPGGEKGLQSLSPGDINDVIDFLMQLAHRPYDATAAGRGAVIFSTRGACYDCHGSDARGDTAIGAPDLADRIWLYGDGSRASIFRSIARGHQGICPAWIKILRPAKIREAAIYVHSLSQGREAAKVR